MQSSAASHMGWMGLLVLVIFALLVGSAEVMGGEDVQPRAPAPATPSRGAEKVGSSSDAAEVIPPPSFGEIIQWGGFIGYVIIALSVVALMLIGKQAFSLRRGVMFPTAVRDKIAALIREKKLKELMEFTRKDSSLLSIIVAAGLSRLRGGYAEMEQVMDVAAEDEAARLEQSVGYFALLAAVAPLLGLLGTVVGMVLAFDRIAKVPGGAPPPSMLAAEIEMALVTTVMGLIVAIPCVVCHTFFRNRLHRLLGELSLEVEELMMPFRGLKPVVVKPPSARKEGAPGAAAVTVASPEAEAAREVEAPALEAEAAPEAANADAAAEPAPDKDAEDSATEAKST